MAAPGSRPRGRLSGYAGDLGAPRRRASTAERDRAVLHSVTSDLGTWGVSETRTLELRYHLRLSCQALRLLGPACGISFSRAG